MPKVKISEFDTVAANNTDIDGINLGEGMLPSDVNNAMRELMAQLKDFQAGTVGDSFNGPHNGTVGASTPAAGTFTSLSDSGNLTFTGTGNRILGDFSNATLANRVAFQNSAANTQTSVSAIPNGTSVSASFSIFNNSDPTNAASFSFLSPAAGGEMSIRSGITGTGTYLPLTMFTGGSERLRINTNGNVGIGTSSPGEILSVVGGSNAFTSLANSGGLKVATYALGTDLGAIGTVSNHPFAIYISNTERMRIDSAGNVGIGTSTPATRLSVSGDISAESSSGETKLNINNTGTGGLRWWIGSTNNSSGAVGGGRLAFYDQTNNTLRMIIGSSGNVGIGTSSPGVRLDVTGSIRASESITIGSGGNYAAGSIYSDANWGLIFRSRTASGGTQGVEFRWTNASDAERMRIDSAGNVGIGTSAPSGRLQISGGILNVGSSPVPAWGSSFPALVMQGGSMTSFSNSTYHGQNWYYDATNTSRYINASTYGLLYEQNRSSGEHIWYNAPNTGTADGAMTLTNRMSISPAGALILAGSTAQKASGTTWSNPSDVRLKDNIRDYTKGTDELMQVRVREWEYNGKGGTVEGTKGLGVIADEVMTVLPNTVENYKAKLNADDAETTDIKKFDATEITWLLVKTVQEQQTLIKNLTTRLNALEGK